MTDNVRDTLISLYELQQIDLRALELQRSAEQIPKKITEVEREAEGLRSELGAMNAESEILRKEQRDAEATIRDDNAKVQKWARRLIEIKTPREYQALDREVEQLRRGIRMLEERVVEIMEQLEARDKVVAEKQVALRETETRINEQVRELRGRQAQLRGEASDISRGRTEITQKLPAELVNRYERIRERRQGSAVVLTQGEFCGGCNVQIRPQRMVDIRHLNSVEQCPTCQRILVLESLVKKGASES